MKQQIFMVLRVLMGSWPKSRREDWLFRIIQSIIERKLKRRSTAKIKRVDH